MNIVKRLDIKLMLFYVDFQVPTKKCGASNIQVISEYENPAIQLWTLTMYKRNSGRNLLDITIFITTKFSV